LNKSCSMTESDEERWEQERKEREFAYLKLWPAVQEEFKLGATKEEAFRNIYRKSGRNPPSYSEIHDWLQDYYNGMFSEEIGDFHGDVRSAVIGQYLKFESAIYFSGNWKFNRTESMLDSRFMFVYSSHYPKGVSIIDSFSGERRALKYPPSVDSISFQDPIWIDSNLILVKIFESWGVYPMLLLQIDWDEPKWTILDKFVSSVSFYHVIIDSADRTKFALIRSGSNSMFIHRGQITKDRIVMKDHPIEIYAYLWYPKLENDQLYGFQCVHNEQNNRKEWHFQEYALDEKTARKISSIRSWFQSSEKSTSYVWSKNRLFVLIYCYDWLRYFTVASFNSDTHSWSDTKVVGTAFPNSITVDDDDILTIGTIDGDSYDDIQPIYKTVHRFPMRKPDKLSYLAWFTIRRGSMLLGSDLHDKFSPFLPYTCEFRPFF